MSTVTNVKTYPSNRPASRPATQPSAAPKKPLAKKPSTSGRSAPVTLHRDGYSSKQANKFAPSSSAPKVAPQKLTRAPTTKPGAKPKSGLDNPALQLTHKKDKTSLTLASRKWTFGSGQAKLTLGTDLKTPTDAKSSSTPTMAPYLALQGGLDHSLYKGKKGNINLVAEGQMRLSYPFQLGSQPADAKANEKAQSALGSNMSFKAGLKGKLTFNPRLSLSGQFLAQGTLSDPSRIPAGQDIFKGALSGEAMLRYKSGLFDGSLGIAGQYTFGSKSGSSSLALVGKGTIDLGKGLSATLQGKGGLKLDGSSFVDLQALLGWQLNKNLVFQVGAGTSMTRAANGAAKWETRPVAGVTFKF